MKIVRFDDNRIGVTEGDRLVDVTDLAGGGEPWPPVAMNRLIARFDERRDALAARFADGPAQRFSDATLRTPVPWPNKLIAYPVNYHDHAVEMSSRGLANIQGFFLKANSSLSGASEPIELPDLPGREIHHECELAVIIGREGRQIAPADALGHVFGYACLLDMTVRGKEERVMRKSYDSFTPVGPWIVTADEVPDSGNLDMKLWVNGELRQSANTRDLIVDIPQMIAIASSAATLYPGDIIATGTPAGVGLVRGGDIVRIEIAGVGAMSVAVVQGERGRNIVFDKPYEFLRGAAEGASA